jgi:hypothetical protein
MGARKGRPAGPVLILARGRDENGEKEVYSKPRYGLSTVCIVCLHGCCYV